MARNPTRNGMLLSGSLPRPLRFSATSGMMNRACLLALALLFFSGCWKGGRLPASQIAYRHDAVVWVYQTGGQIGRWGFLLAPVRNELLDLQPGEGRVHVTEGQTGGQCSATPQADLQLTHAVDLKTGRSVFATGPPMHVEHPTPICRADKGYWETPIDGNLSVYSAGETGRLYLRSPEDLLILQAKHSDPQVTYQPWLGVPIAAFRMTDDLLVLGLSQGYVVCVDLTKLAIEPAGRTRTSQSMPGKQGRRELEP